MTMKRRVPSLTGCDHGCRLEEVKKSYNHYMNEADDALDFAMHQYNSLAMFLLKHVIPYLEFKAHQQGDEDAQDLLLDLAIRVYDFREKF